MHINIGVSGTGFISTGFFQLVNGNPNYSISKVLSRRPIASFSRYQFADLVTNNVDELIESCDVIFECSGDAIFASEVINQAFLAGKPVVTMNAEFQICAGTYFQELGLLHESAGDQPGSLAALNQEVQMMGFEPVLYGSQKSHLNPNPDREYAEHWAKMNHQSVEKTVSFSDGTKVQIETALVANGLGTEILQDGLMGPSAVSTKDGAFMLAELAEQQGKVVSDFVLHKEGLGEVFIVAKHQENHRAALSYYKFGQGPYYFIQRSFHLGHFEILNSINSVLNTSVQLFNNGLNPTISVAAVAKQDISAGTFLAQGVGSFEVRGKAVKIEVHPNHVPIALLQNCEIQRSIKRGEIVTFNDVALPDSLAYRAWKHTHSKTLNTV